MHLFIALDNSPLNDTITRFLKTFINNLADTPSLSFVHVIDDRFTMPAVGYPDIAMNYDAGLPYLENSEQLISQLENEGKRIVDQIMLELGIQGTTYFPKGDPATELADACNHHHPDFLIMGSHSRTGLNHFLIGNLAEKVMRHVATPVIIVPVHEKEN